MPFRRIEAEKLSHSVVKQIEKLALRGILRPGDRLPSERELSERLGVSRPLLREAIAELQSRSLLTTRAGAGIYVTDVLGPPFRQPLSDFSASMMMQFSTTSPFARIWKGSAQRHSTNGRRSLVG